MNKMILGTLAVALVALAFPAHAADCDYQTDDGAVAVSVQDQTYYVLAQNDLCQPGCVFSVWVYTYEETNGVAGLQREDTTCSDGSVVLADEGNGPIL